MYGWLVIDFQLQLLFLIGLDNYRVQNELADRRFFDEQVFREAGAKKAQRTYKFDPTKPIVAKK